MSARDVHLLSGAYALHAVTDDEAAAIEAAMAESEELRNEVVGLADTAVALGLAVPQAAPSPELRAALLTAIETTPQLGAEPSPVRDESAARRAERHVAPRRRRWITRPVVLLSAGLAALLLFGGGVVAQRALIEPELDYNRVVAAADAQAAPRQAVQGGGTIIVTTSRSEGSTAILLAGVRPPAGDALQLWILHGETAVSAGLYDVGDDGEVIHRVPASGDRIAVTVEPAGGSKQPTTIPITVVDLA